MMNPTGPGPAHTVAIVHSRQLVRDLLAHAVTAAGLHVSGTHADLGDLIDARCPNPGVVLVEASLLVGVTLGQRTPIVALASEVTAAETHRLHAAGAAVVCAMSCTIEACVDVLRRCAATAARARTVTSGSAA